MLDYLRALLDSDSLSPHGICLLWRPELIWTHVVSDTLIGLSYLSIPLALGYLVSKRSDIAFGWVFWCFVIFILACGTTHFLSILTLWQPVYGIEAVVKAVTALASVATAAALWPLLPRALALPSPGQLRAANAALTARIAERDRALHALEQATAERVETEDMLRQSQKMEAIGQLTGGVAHDFNNLLAVIMANLERVERNLPDGSTLLRPVRDAMTGAERAAAVTDKLLAFARKQPLRPLDIKADALIEDLSTLSRGALGDEVELRTRFAPDLWPVRVDPNQLENAILNLLVNARDAMRPGNAGWAEISTRNLPAADAARLEGTDPAQDYVAIEIADNGAGMSPEVASRAFDPFYTTKPLGQGTGLGLSQVFGFAKQSGGHAAIESDPERGTRVLLLLPRLKPDVNRDASSFPSRAGAPVFPKGLIASS